MAVRNQQTGLYEARKILSTGHEYIGTGHSKEEAKADLAKQLKEIEIDYGPYENEAQCRKIQQMIASGRLNKYNPPMKKVGTMNSPGFEMVIADDGRLKYEFNANRTVPVMARDLTARQAVEEAKS